MSVIKILPENLANQIAAGEVIERPASVVKEFVENAIDAEAANLTIQIEGDGSRLLRVVDDGIGMEQDDVLLCLERHATSKLNSAEQLSNINTLGFRGEAIPSIASVSKLTITSRPQTAALGTRAEIKFGKMIKVHDMGCAPGTVMEVKDLFGNLPVRRKFLKSKQTEISHIDEIVKSYALVNPEIGFVLQVQGRVVLDLPPENDNLAGRVAKIACRTGNESLVTLAKMSSESENGVAVTGFLLAPETTVGSGRLRTFVNGRVVKDRMINHAVIEGLQGFLLKGRRAAGVVYITVPPHLVDVNVHPTKQEIRFQQANRVHDAIAKTVRGAMESHQDQVRHSVFGAPTPELHRSVGDEQPSELVATPSMQPGQEEEGTIESDSVSDFKSSEKGQKGAAQLSSPSAALAKQQKPEGIKVSSSAAIDYQNRKASETVAPETVLPPLITEEQGAETTYKSDKPSPSEEKVCVDSGREKLQRAASAFNGGLTAVGRQGGTEPFPRYVGLLFNTYILCEANGELLVVDQHAAQERLIFEKLRRQYSDNAMPGQVLLSPEIVDLDPIDMELVELYGEQIKRLGLDIKEFGGDSYIIKAVPAALRQFGPVEILRGILDRFSSEDGKGSKAVRLEGVLAGMACKSAIKAGVRLLPEEVKALLKEMAAAGIFSHCPHGRPVVKTFSKNDVKKWFLRT